jgi:hypothetical protein
MGALPGRFTAYQACLVTGITYRQLDYWAREGLAIPATPAQGSGSRRRYDYDDLIRLRVARELADIHCLRAAAPLLPEIGKASTDQILVGGRRGTWELRPLSQAATALVEQEGGVMTHVLVLGRAIADVGSSLLEYMAPV